MPFSLKSPDYDKGDAVLCPALLREDISLFLSNHKLLIGSMSLFNTKAKIVETKSNSQFDSLANLSIIVFKPVFSHKLLKTTTGPYTLAYSAKRPFEASPPARTGRYNGPFL